MNDDVGLRSAMRPIRDALGAFCRHSEAVLPGAPAGPLAGLSFGAKDIYDVAGHVTGCGNPDWLGSHAPAAETAPAVARLVAAGAAMVGKTQTDELAFSLNGENFHYGTPVNSRCPDRIPGGSSSGSAAAVAGGLVDFALGSDTGGSVRVPASLCGLYGIRPTHGRVPLTGVMPLAPSFDTAGWFTRDAALLRRVGEVLIEGAAAERAWRPARLLLASDAFALADAAVAAALQAVVGALPGSPVQTVTVSPGRLDSWMQSFRVLQAGEIWACHGAWIRGTEPAFGPLVRERFEMTSRIGEAEIAAAARMREQIVRRMDLLLGEDAVLLLPSAPCIAPLKGAPAAELERYRARTLSLTCIAGLARLPQVGLPLAEVQGCPVGLSLIAPRGRDLGLLAFAEELPAPSGP